MAVNKETHKTVSVIMPIDMYKEMLKAAEIEKRSFSSEVLYRLEKLERLENEGGRSYVESN